MELAQSVGIVALALILFEGGLAAGWSEIRPVFGVSVSLATVGTVATAAIVGLSASWLLDLSTLEGLLLGSIVAVSDSAAIFSVLRGSSVEKRLARALEGESGFNDPVAIVLVLGFIEYINEPGYGAWDMVLLAVEELGIGALVGLAVGRLAVIGFREAQVSTNGLYPVASIAAAALAFGAADALHGSGFMAVYLAGLSLGSAAIPGRRTIEDFHDGLAWISQIVMFLTLGLLVNPSQFGDIVGEAILIAAVLMFVARPLATLLATAGAHMNLRESALVGWAGLRGAVPIVLATFPVIEGIDQAGSFFNIVFFVVLTSTLVQGATDRTARALAGADHRRARALHARCTRWARSGRLGAEVLEFPVGESDALVGLMVNQLELPREALVSVIVRDDEALLPRGSTEVEAGDQLHILVRGQVRAGVEELFDRWRSGPLGEPTPAVAPKAGRAPIFHVRPWRESMGDPGAPGADRRRRGAADPCAPGASSPARSCCSPTAGSRSPARAWWPSAAHASSFATAASASAARSPARRRRGGRRWRAWCRRRRCGRRRRSSVAGRRRRRVSVLWALRPPGGRVRRPTAGTGGSGQAISANLGVGACGTHETTPVTDATARSRPSGRPRLA